MYYQKKYQHSHRVRYIRVQLHTLNYCDNNYHITHRVKTVHSKLDVLSYKFGYTIEYHHLYYILEQSSIYECRSYLSQRRNANCQNKCEQDTDAGLHHKQIGQASQNQKHTYCLPDRMTTIRDICRIEG